jgi:hypothetical protein
MKWFRREKTFAFALSLVAICAWIVAGNHCALGLMNAPKTAHHACCSEGGAAPKPQGGKQTPPCCCNVVKIATVAQAKHLVAGNSFHFAVRTFFVALFSFVDPRFLPSHSCEIGTGPPGVISFAELILQRSIQAHAPPSLA